MSDRLGKTDSQRIRIVALRGAEKRALFWLTRRGDDLYGNVSGLGFHYSRHASGRFHRSEEGTGPGQPPPVAIITTTWRKPRISAAVPGLREEFARVVFVFGQDWGSYPVFTMRKEFDDVVEIGSTGVNLLSLNIWLTDTQNAGSLRLVQDQANADLRRLCSEIVETGRQWLLLVEAYDTTAPLPPLRDEDLPPLNYAEAFKARLLGKIRFREYLAISNKQLGLKS